ncbi:MAG TPA: hypothetical protein VJV78_25250 [Polyangiales bacterium]|nr:hypothetical protein [Polyangiales bacterium]
MRWLAISLGALTLSAAGCASLESTVRTRAAADLHCGEDQLQIVDQESTVFRVAGCGEKATYICSDNASSFRTHCKRADWDEHEQAAAQPLAAQPNLQR